MISMVKRCGLLVSVWLSCCALAQAATYNVNSSQSTSAIQSVISGTSAGDTVSFAAGTYSITTGLTLKCGVTYTGPVATPATAILSSTFGISGNVLNLYAGGGFAVPCTTTTTIEYLATKHSGGLYVQSSFSNIVITHNQFGSLPCCGTNPQASTSGIYLDGGSSTAQMLTNATITWNTIGDSSSCTGPTWNDMTDYTSPEQKNGNCQGIGIITNLNGVTIKNNIIGPVGEGVHVLCFHGTTCEPPNGPTTNGLVAMYNDFPGIHRIAWEEQSQVTSNTFFQYNSEHDATNPYFGNFALSMACCDTGATAPGITVSDNVLLQNAAPHVRYGYGIEAWGLSAIYSNNLIQGLASSQGISWCYGMHGGTASNNTIQGPNYGSGTDPSGGNNYLGNENINSPPCGVAAPWSPSTMSGNVTGSSIAVVPSTAPSISPAPGSQLFPLTVTLTDAGYTSGAKARGNTGIWYTTDGSSPVPGAGSAKRVDSGGTFTMAVAGTVKAVGMWGAANQPASYPSGYGFTPSPVVSATYTGGGLPMPAITSVTLATTGGVSSINLGSSNQLLATCHYSDGSSTSCNTPDTHGNGVTLWSSTNTATVTISSSGLASGVAVGSSNLTATVAGLTNTPALALAVVASNTLLSAYLSTPGNQNTGMPGTTIQFSAICHYASGPDQDCTVTDIYGDGVTAWASTSTPVVTVQNVGAPNPGLATAVGTGTAQIQATISNKQSTPWVLTITPAPVTLTNLSLTTTGGATSVAIGGTNQLLAICTYSDASTTSCNTTDVHGNQASGWTSSNPSLATISGSGLVTAVSAGLPSFTATAGGDTSAPLPVTMTLIPSGTYVITIKGPVTITGTVHF